MNNKFKNILSGIMLILTIFIILNRDNLPGGELGEFFGTMTLVLMGATALIFPLIYVQKYVKEYKISSYVKLLSKFLRKNHAYIAALAIMILAVHISVVTVNRPLFSLETVLAEQNLFGYLAVLMIIINLIFAIIFKFIKKTKLVIKIHKYSAIIFFFIIIFHIL